MLDKEREIARAQAKNDPKMANKPEQVIEKIVEGRLNKFTKRRCCSISRLKALRRLSASW